MRIVNLTCPRGDSFVKPFRLLNGWESSDLSNMWFTVRRYPPSGEIVDDLDAGVLGQASLLGGGITFNDDSVTEGQIRIPSNVVDEWPLGKFYWDFQFRTAGSLADIRTPVGGRITVPYDITRTQV